MRRLPSGVNAMDSEWFGRSVSAATRNSDIAEVGNSRLWLRRIDRDSEGVDVGAARALGQVTYLIQIIRRAAEAERMPRVETNAVDVKIPAAISDVDHYLDVVPRAWNPAEARGEQRSRAIPLPVKNVKVGRVGRPQGALRAFVK